MKGNSPKVINDLDNFKKNLLANDLNEAEFTMYEIQDYFSNIIIRNELGKLNAVARKISEFLDESEIKDQLSFIYGKLFTLVEMSEKILVDYNIEDRIRLLTPKEKDVLLCIHKYEELSVTDISKKLNASINHVSNILSELRSVNAVCYRNFGKERIYTLATIGRKMSELIIKQTKIELNDEIQSFFMSEFLHQELINVKVERRLNEDSIQQGNNFSVSRYNVLVSGRFSEDVTQKIILDYEKDKDEDEELYMPYSNLLISDYTRRG